MADIKDKLKALTDKINKKYNSNTLAIGAELASYELINTPFASLNALIGGFPRGKFTTIAG